MMGLHATTAGAIRSTPTRDRGEGSLVKRKLTIRTKLAATLAVPLAALASFAALQVRDAYNKSDEVQLQAGSGDLGDGAGRRADRVGERARLRSAARDR